MDLPRRFPRTGRQLIGVSIFGAALAGSDERV